MVGCAAARELARRGRQVVVIEKNPGVSRGENQSSRNSGVIHSGLYYDRASRPLKARLCARGADMLYRFCQEHDVPALRCGKLVAASRPEEIPMLDVYEQRARENGVPVNRIGAEAIRELEPAVSALQALHLPSSGIIDAAALVHKLYALASRDGAFFQTETEVTAVRPRARGLELTLRYRDGAQDTVLTRRLINCAGLYFDQVARMADPDSPYRVDPLRGEALKFYRAKRPDIHLRGMNVYPTPRKVVTDRGEYFTVGVHLTPTLDIDPRGRVRVGPAVTVGPLNRQATGRRDYGGDYRPTSEFLEATAGFFPGLRESDLEPFQAGIQARMVGHQDWRVEFSPREPRCLNLLGIDSPGLTGSLALAQYVGEMLDASEAGRLRRP